MNRHRNDGIDPVARSRSRRRALQAIYAWQLSATSEGALIAEFAHEQAHEVADLEYFEDLVRGVLRHVAELDAPDQRHADSVDLEVRDVEPARVEIRAVRFDLLDIDAGNLRKQLVHIVQRKVLDMLGGNDRDGLRRLAQRQI